MAENARLFLKLTEVGGANPILGEAMVTEFAGQIELEDWNWTLSRDASDGSLGRGKGGTGDNAGRGSVSPSPLAVSKYVDRSTPSLLEAMNASKILEGELTLEEAADVEFEVKISLKQVRLVSYELEADVEDRGGELREKWTLNYEEIKFVYKVPGGGGAAVDAVIKRDPAASTDAPESPKLAELRKAVLSMPSKQKALDEVEKIWREKEAEEAEAAKGDGKGKAKAKPEQTKKKQS